MSRYESGPYYIIETDKGLLSQRLHQPPYRNRKTKQLGSVSLFTQPVEFYDSWYKEDYTDKNEHWKPCIKMRCSYASVVKRRSLESINGIVEKINNNVWTDCKRRFPNPRVIFIEDSVKEFLQRRLDFVNSVKVNYEVWNW